MLCLVCHTFCVQVKYILYLQTSEFESCCHFLQTPTAIKFTTSQASHDIPNKQRYSKKKKKGLLVMVTLLESDVIFTPRNIRA